MRRPHTSRGAVVDKRNADRPGEAPGRSAGDRLIG
jgi:hypothetical protein